MGINGLKERRILLVDDEPALRELVVSILRGDGYLHVAAAGNGYYSVVINGIYLEAISSSLHR